MDAFADYNRVAFTDDSDEDAISDYPCQFCDRYMTGDDHVLVIKVNMYPPNDNKGKRYVHIDCLRSVALIATDQVEAAMAEHLEDLDRIDKTLDS